MGVWVLYPECGIMVFTRTKLEGILLYHTKGTTHSTTDLYHDEATLRLKLSNMESHQHHLVAHRIRALLSKLRYRSSRLVSTDFFTLAQCLLAPLTYNASGDVVV